MSTRCAVGTVECPGTQSDCSMVDKSHSHQAQTTGVSQSVAMSLKARVRVHAEYVHGGRHSVVAYTATVWRTDSPVSLERLTQTREASDPQVSHWKIGYS